MLTFTEAITEVLKDGGVRIVKLKNHAKVGYQDHPLGDKQCSGCSMFKPPDGCTEVEPPISPSGYCQLYERSDISHKLRELFADPSGVGKQQPGAADVHATTALGNEGRKRKAKDFLTTISEMKDAKVVDVLDDVGKADALAEAMEDVARGMHESADFIEKTRSDMLAASSAKSDDVADRIWKMRNAVANHLSAAQEVLKELDRRISS